MTKLNISGKQYDVNLPADAPLRQRANGYDSCR